MCIRFVGPENMTMGCTNHACVGDSDSDSQDFIYVPMAQLLSNVIPKTLGGWTPHTTYECKKGTKGCYLRHHRTQYT